MERKLNITADEAMELNKLKMFTGIDEIPLDIDNRPIILKNHKTIKTDDFKKEINLVDYIILNIDKFAKEILQDEIIEFETEKNIVERCCFSPRGKRVDLYIKGKKKDYIIEFKNPKYYHENRCAIGQLLDYGREFSDSKKDLILITTKFDLDTARTIKYYNLPIRYIYLSKKHIMEYLGDDGK